MNTYYPVVTIVKLSLDKDRLFMIAGYFTKQGDGHYHDYFAVPFPLGLIKENQYLSFNANCITEVVQLGYCDDDCQKVLDGLDEFTQNIKKHISEQAKK